MSISFDYKTRVTLAYYKYLSEPRLPSSLGEVVNLFSELLLSIPQQFRDTATVKLDANIEYDSPYWDMEVFYWRPPTQEEIIERMQAAGANAERARLRDLQHLAELKAKYE